MEIRNFEKSDFDVFVTWFSDAKLNAELGPMDQEWLDYVLVENLTSQFSFFKDNRLLAVIGIERPRDSPKNEIESAFAITDIAVDPSSRRSGIGAASLAMLIEHVASNSAWIAFVSPDNVEAQRFFRAQGFQATNPDSEHETEMICFKRT